MSQVTGLGELPTIPSALTWSCGRSSEQVGGKLILRGINAFARFTSAALVVLLMGSLIVGVRAERVQASLVDGRRGRCQGARVTGGGGALERAVHRKGPGTTFCIGRGTYSVSQHGLKLQDGDKLNGAGRARPSPRGNRPVVRIVGRGHKVIFGGARVRLLDVSVTDSAGRSTCSSSSTCGQTVKPGTAWRLRGVRVHHADAQCIGSPGHSLVITESEIDHCGNRFDGKDQNGFAGAIKGGINGAFTVTRSRIHNNNQGVWCDVDCSSQHMPFTVIGNVILDNYSFGVHYEHTTKNPSTPARAVIQGNRVRGNNWGRFGTKADIGIMSAENALVRNNELGGTRAHPRRGNGIMFRSTAGRGEASGAARDNRLRGDSLEGCSLEGVSCQ